MSETFPRFYDRCFFPFQSGRVLPAKTTARFADRGPRRHNGDRRKCDSALTASRVDNSRKRYSLNRLPERPPSWPTSLDYINIFMKFNYEYSVVRRFRVIRPWRPLGRPKLFQLTVFFVRRQSERNSRGVMGSEKIQVVTLGTVC